MGRKLDLTGAKREYLTIELDEIGVLNLEAPTKEMFQELIAYIPELSKLENIDPDNPSSTVNEDISDGIDALYDLTATLMSRNREKRIVKASELEPILPFDMAIVFVNGYADFVNEIRAKREKN